MKVRMAMALAAMAAASAAGGAAPQGKPVVNRLSSRCIDVSGAPGVANGAKIQLWDCERSGTPGQGPRSDQFWEFSNGFIRNTVSGKCIDVAGAPGVANGAKIQLWDCEISGRSTNGSPSDQQWTLRRDGAIVNRVSGKCIDVPGNPGVARGVQLQLWTCEADTTATGAMTDQRWTF